MTGEPCGSLGGEPARLKVKPVTGGVTALWFKDGKGWEEGEVREVRPGSLRPGPEDNGGQVLERVNGFSGGESQVSVQEERKWPGWVEWETQRLWGLGLLALFIIHSSLILPVPEHTGCGPHLTLGLVSHLDIKTWICCHSVASQMTFPDLCYDLSLHPAPLSSCATAKGHKSQAGTASPMTGPSQTLERVWASAWWSSFGKSPLYLVWPLLPLSLGLARGHSGLDGFIHLQMDSHSLGRGRKSHLMLMSFL